MDRVLLEETAAQLERLLPRINQLCGVEIHTTLQRGVRLMLEVAAEWESAFERKDREIRELNRGIESYRVALDNAQRQLRQQQRPELTERESSMDEVVRPASALIRPRPASTTTARVRSSTPTRRR